MVRATAKVNTASIVGSGSRLVNIVLKTARKVDSTRPFQTKGGGGGGGGGQLLCSLLGLSFSTNKALT